MRESESHFRQGLALLACCSCKTSTSRGQDTQEGGHIVFPRAGDSRLKLYRSWLQSQQNRPRGCCPVDVILLTPFYRIRQLHPYAERSCTHSFVYILVEAFCIGMLSVLIRKTSRSSRWPPGVVHLDMFQLTACWPAAADLPATASQLELLRRITCRCAHLASFQEVSRRLQPWSIRKSPYPPCPS